MRILSKRVMPFFSLLLLAGCAHYTKPSIQVETVSYTQMQEKEKSLIPAQMTDFTLPIVQKLALKNNPDFRSIQFAMDSARARYYQSLSFYAPTLNAGLSFSQSFNRTYSSHNTQKTHGQNDSFGPSLSGQWLIFDCLAREFNVLSSEVGMDQTQNQIDDARRLLLRGVAYAYNEVMLNLTQLKIFKAQLEYNKDMLLDAEKKYKAGTTLLSDVLNFRVAVKNTELSIIETSFSIKANKYILAGYLGLTDGTIPDLIRFPEIKVPDEVVMPRVEFYIDMALQCRPDLKALRDEFQMSKYSYWTSLSNMGPTITADYSASYNSGQRLQYGEDGYRSSTSSDVGNYNYGIYANWNLFDGLYDYNNIKIAIAEMAQADYNQAQTWIGIITDVRTAYENFLSSMEQAKKSKEIAELTKETRDLVVNEYNAGTALVTRVNEVEKDLVTAQNDLATAIINISNAKAQLDAAVFRQVD